MSRVAVTGSSGLIGTAVRNRLGDAGHEVVRVLRGNPSDPAALWNPATGWVREGALDGVDAVVHLAGESIAEGRWNAARKAALAASRVPATRLLVDHIATLDRKPAALIAASAVGFYGDRGDEPLTEASASGTGFLAGLVRDWERESLRAGDLGLRVALLRFGVVLHKDGGALPRMLMPFRFGLGGRLGNGRQWMPWISRDDAAAAVVYTVENDLDGAVNVVAPGAVTNAEFAKALGRALRRPALLPTPKIGLRLLLGQAADELLFASQRVVPERLQERGFAFAHPGLEAALAAALR